MVSILRSGGTVFGAVASTDERADSSSAEAADAFSEYTWRTHSLAAMAEDTARHSGVGGCAFVHVEWDPSRGRPIEYEEETLTRPPEIDDEGTLIDEGEWDTKTTVEPEGDHLFTRLTTRQVVADPAAQRDQTGSGIFIRQELPRATIKRTFDLSDENTPSTSAGAEDIIQVRRMADPPGDASLGGADTDTRDSAVVWTFYAPSNKKHRRGLRVVFSEGKLLDCGDNPIYPEEDEPEEMWPRCQWPIFQLQFIQRPHSYYGLGVVPKIIPQQKALNGIASKALQHIAKVANAKALVPEGRKQDFTDEVGQVIGISRKDRSDAYKFMQPPPLSPEYLQLWNKYDAEIQSGFGINAATTGQSTYADDSGRKVQALQERDVGRLEPVKQRQDQVWGEVVLYALRLFRRYATTPRKIAIAGANQELAIKSFDASDLAGVADIMVFNDQSIPRDPSGKILWVNQFMQSGILQLPPDQQQDMFNMLRLRDFKGLMSRKSHHRMKAHRATVQIMAGESPVLWEEDDHLQHMAELSTLRTSEEFEKRVRDEGGVEQSPTLKSFDNVYGYHKSIFEKKTQEQMQGPSGQPGAPAGMGASPTAPAESPTTAPGGMQ